MTRPGGPFRDPAAIARLLEDLRALPEPARPLTFMHVCGTHENAIARYGLRPLLPPWLRLIAGPGCPVCVCPKAEISAVGRLARDQGVILASFGDMVRVPARPSLEQVRAEGGDVRVVLGVDDAVALARVEPSREVVFFAVGFETTACTTAAALLADPPPNFSVWCAHRLIPPALHALLGLEDVPVDGFLLPGHVLTVTGTAEYHAAVELDGRPAAVAGFEPLDLLLGLAALVRDFETGAPRFTNAYARAVRPEGNPTARRAMALAFEVTDAAWRGLGVIPRSGFEVAPALAAHDARRRYLRPGSGEETGAGAAEESARGCRCGDVMVGRIEPAGCPLFGTTCTPDTPQGACMVSVEGTCRTRHHFREV